MERLLVILDGMQDDFLNERKACPSLDRIELGGVLQTCPPGMQPDSAVCISSLLGVQEDELPHGRSYLEALAREIPFTPQDVLLRCSLSVQDREGHLLSSSADGYSAGEIERMQLFLQREIAGYYPLGGYRGILRVPSQFQPEELKLPPPHQHLGEKLSSLLSAGIGWDIMRRSRELLFPFTQREAHPFLYPWAPSKGQALPSFWMLHQASAISVCAADIMRGISVEMGIACPQIPGATGDIDTDLAEKRSAVLRALPLYDLVILHLNGADEASHRRDIAQKRAFLQRVDREILCPLLKREGLRLLVCSDHATFCSTGAHSAQPQRYYANFSSPFPAASAVGLILAE